MPEKLTMTVRADHLPPEMRARLRPLPGTHYRVTAEPVEESDAEKLAALQAHIAQGLADADAGRVFEHDDVFGELKARYPDA